MMRAMLLASSRLNGQAFGGPERCSAQCLFPGANDCTAIFLEWMNLISTEIQAIPPMSRCPLWVNFCRPLSRNARLLYPTKLPHRLFAIEAVTGQEQPPALR